MSTSTGLCRFGVCRMFKFMVGAGKAAFMSVTEVIVVAEADMVLFFFYFGWFSYSASSVGDY